MYLLDSNILIYYLNGEGSVGSFFSSEVSKFISIISITELLAKPSLDIKEELLIMQFLDRFRILPLDVVVAKRAAELKRKHNLMFPDAIIAATTELFDLVLITRDRGFKKVSEIRTLTL